MISARVCIVIFVTLAHVHLTTAKIFTPNKTQENTDFGLPQQMNPMQMAYSQSIPEDARIACEQQQATACPSPSSDGSYRCINIGDICDHRPQCPGAEDETPVLCFFHEMRFRELTRLRNYAISLYRIPPNIPRRHSQRIHGY